MSSSSKGTWIMKVSCTCGKSQGEVSLDKDITKLPKKGVPSLDFGLSYTIKEGKFQVNKDQLLICV